MQVNFEEVNFVYNPETPYENKVLKNVSLEIPSGSFTAIIGKTGSGKSTLIEHINGILIANSGSVKLNNFTIEKKKTRKENKLLEKNLVKIREKVAMLFQFSEQQLFANTVLEDIMFAPINYGISKEDSEKRAYELIEMIGLNKEYLKKSPFELSGGEMRKVALCGVLAQSPDILILDEPFIGLDFKSKNELMNLINKIYREQNITIVFITHDMEFVLKYATDIVIMKNGEVVVKTKDKDEFVDILSKEEYNLSLPEIIDFQNALKERGVVLSKLHYDYESLLKDIMSRLEQKNE
ncbi:energy-coupling factor transporter ATPase [Gemella sp. GH3]|uniref:ATP-binding cassette domain-containing protein n=1 Tax=unclassified Gemella TaxID=2624949 RepID=UPI0015D099B9|nr:MULTISPECIES: ATP-binding cassette domain-containing protein [unclassified Gemella]MBF0713196.1 energy-coupling factor transporter ATPase [Gemella sp. GH3.1]NYS50148.1 energy-coupling factor transporter ATPase [Gemella sp. GH3]